MSSAVDRLVDCVVIDLLGCAVPRSAAATPPAAYHHPSPSKTYHHPASSSHGGDSRADYSMFDLIAGCGTGFLINLCITVVVPVALSSIESRNHPSPLSASGSVAATTSLGMILSVAFMYQVQTARPHRTAAPALKFSMRP